MKEQIREFVGVAIFVFVVLMVFVVLVPLDVTLVQYLVLFGLGVVTAYGGLLFYMHSI